MSRSRRHTPVVGIAMGTSEREDKRKANRALRRGVRTALTRTEDDPEALPKLREVSDVWGMAKDGRQWINPQKYPKLMRK
jgi:hypothetical protein